MALGEVCNFVIAAELLSVTYFHFKALKSRAAATTDSFGSKNICSVSFHVFSHLAVFGVLSSARLLSFHQPFFLRGAPGLDETLGFYAAADLRPY